VGIGPSGEQYKKGSGKTPSIGMPGDVGCVGVKSERPGRSRFLGRSVGTGLWWWGHLQTVK